MLRGFCRGMVRQVPACAKVTAGKQGERGLVELRGKVGVLAVGRRGLSFAGYLGDIFPVVTEFENRIAADLPGAIKPHQGLVEQFHALLRIHADDVGQLKAFAFTDEVPYRGISQHDLDSGYPARAVGLGYERLAEDGQQQ